jgi:hypothetical protein
MTRSKRFVRPHNQRGALSDLYISPSDNRIDLKRGEKLKHYHYEFTYFFSDWQGFHPAGMKNLNAVISD